MAHESKALLGRVVPQSGLLLPWLLCLLLVSACSGGHPQAKAAPKTVFRPSAVQLTGHSFAGVDFGTPTAEAERRLILLLGMPTGTRVGGCALGVPANNEHARYLTWGHLTAHLSDLSRLGQRQAQQLTGWELQPGTEPFAVTLPNGINLGASLGQVRAASHVIREGPTYLPDTLEVDTDFADYIFSSANGSGGVTTISKNVMICE